jgi:predicted ester cyclase
MSTDLKAIIRKSVEQFNNPATRQKYLDLYDANATIHGLPMPVPPGIVGIKMYYEAMWNAFPDSKVMLDDLISEGDRVAIRFTFTGTHKGEFLAPPTNKKISVGGHTILRMANGKCVERWNLLDFVALMTQLGLMPATK